MENDSDIVLDWITKYLASQSYDEDRTKSEKRAIRKNLRATSYALVNSSTSIVLIESQRHTKNC